MSHRKCLALIDGHALAFRAFHAMKEAGLRSSTGEPTYAVFGFAQILLTMIQEYQPEYVAVCFDVGRTFRDDMYADYKAGRAETPEEFHPQLQRIQQLVRTLNIPIYTREGYEADDVIGALSVQAAAHDVETIILTGDTDSLQLVNDHVQVLLANPYAKGKNTTLYDEAAVRERYEGLAPAQLADLRGLKGDVTDNIPGVKGIGEKGAINLLNQFGTVENLYDHLDEVPNRYKKALDGQREAALFSKRLATIVCDVPGVQLNLQDAALGDYDRPAMIRLFQELEIGASSGLIKKLPPTSGGSVEADVLAELTAPTRPGGQGPVVQHDMFDAALPESLPAPQVDLGGGTMQLALFDDFAPVAPALPPPNAHGEYQAITTEAQLDALVNQLNAASGFAFDTEATGLRPFESELVGVSIAITPGVAYYIPVAHRAGEQLPRDLVVNALRPFFEDPARPKFAHNAKFDIEVLLTAGVEVQGLSFDTMIAAGLLGKQRVGLKDLAFYELRLAEPLTAIEELIGRGAKQVTFDQVAIDLATPYAAADADMTLRLKLAFEEQLAQNERIHSLFTRLEMPLVPVLVSMERVGIALDPAYIRSLGGRLEARIAELETEIHGFAGGKFNIGSSDQLAEVLFERLGISSQGVGRTAKTKKYSITAEVLEQLQDRHPIFPLILRYRQLTKLKSTYVDSLPSMVNAKTGRVHTSYSQIGAATGRLSSIDPNLQNIPVRTQEGREIRRGFVAAPGHTFVAADYSQIELRVLAHVTKDTALLDTFREGRDIHATTASRLFGVAPEHVDKNQRRIAKTVVFGIVYGISSFGLSQRLGLDRATSQELINGVFATYPGLKAYIDEVQRTVRETGYVSTLFGRRRYFAGLAAGDKGPQAQTALREAINAPIQGTAADLMKIAMVNTKRALDASGLRTRMLLQVHDELILEAPEEEVDGTAKLVCDVMEGVYELDVPLGVEVEAGPNWDNLKPLEVVRS